MVWSIGDDNIHKAGMERSFSIIWQYVFSSFKFKQILRAKQYMQIRCHILQSYFLGLNMVQDFAIRTCDMPTLLARRDLSSRSRLKGKDAIGWHRTVNNDIKHVLIMSSFKFSLSLYKVKTFVELKIQHFTVLFPCVLNGLILSASVCKFTVFGIKE